MAGLMPALSREALDRLQAADKTSRYRFSVVAAEILAHVLKQDRTILLSVVAAGQDAFVRTASGAYAAQDFKREDLVRIFERLRAEAMNTPADPARLAHG